MRVIPAQVIAEPGEQVVLTGKIQGSVTTQDGTTYDLSNDAVGVDPDHAAEVAHLVGLRYAAEGHPDDPPDAEFVYQAPKEFKNYEPHAENPDSIAPTEG